MVAEYFFQEFQENQARTLHRAAAAYQAYQEALQAGRSLKGGMHWKHIRGRDYLYKYRDRYGHGHSLGPRSPDTERLWTEFSRQRREAAARLADRRLELAEAARFCRAALIHRVLDPVTRILQRFTPEEFAGAPPLVIDAHALHAFEFAAGVFIRGPRESPLWADALQGLTLAAPAPVAPDEFLARLRRADRSYRALPGDGLAAVNQAGFRVRLANSPGVRSPQRLMAKDAPGATVPAASGDLTALMGAPKFSQVVIGRRGAPVLMTVPDPRALALHLLWSSQQEDRPPPQQTRDRLRAIALAELILRYLPQYHFFSADLQRFPVQVARLGETFVEGYEMGGGPEAD